MKVVLDASAAVGVALGGDRSGALARLLDEADEVLAPDLLVAEVTNVVWKYHYFEGLALDICDQVLSRALGLVDSLVPCREIHREAFLLARVTRRPAYDMFYLALARREDAALLTLDAALRKEAVRQGLRVA